MDQPSHQVRSMVSITILRTKVWANPAMRHGHLVSITIIFQCKVWWDVKAISSPLNNHPALGILCLANNCAWPYHCALSTVFFSCFSRFPQLRCNERDKTDSGFQGQDSGRRKLYSKTFITFCNYFVLVLNLWWFFEQCTNYPWTGVYHAFVWCEKIP